MIKAGNYTRKTKSFDFHDVLNGRMSMNSLIRQEGNRFNEIGRVAFQTMQAIGISQSAEKQGKHAGIARSTLHEFRLLNSSHLFDLQLEVDYEQTFVRRMIEKPHLFDIQGDLGSIVTLPIKRVTSRSYPPQGYDRISARITDRVHENSTIYEITKGEFTDLSIRGTEERPLYQHKVQQMLAILAFSNEVLAGETNLSIPETLLPISNQ